MSPKRYQASDPLLTEEERAALQSIGLMIQRPAGTVFMTEGEQSDFVLLINKGTVKIKTGRHIIALRHDGEIVGELAPIRGKPRSATVEAATEVVVLQLSAAQWLDFLDANPRAALALISTTGDRLDQATRKIRDSDSTVERRLAQALLDFEGTDLARNGAEGIEVTTNRQELASLTGAGVDAINDALRSMREHGLIRTDDRQLTLVDVDRIRAIASGNATRP